MHAEPTTNINIRNVPREFIQKVKVAAAQRGITMRELMLAAIEKEVKPGGGK